MARYANIGVQIGGAEGLLGGYGGVQMPVVGVPLTPTPPIPDEVAPSPEGSAL
jgi:hypothetical protein